MDQKPIPMERRGPTQESDSKATVPDSDQIFMVHELYEERLFKRQVGTAAVTGLTFLVFLINLTILIWAATKDGSVTRIKTLKRGNCKKLDKVNTWVHLMINILGTAVLSGSNYCMQRLSAPTRDELDSAHTSGKWLNIGVPSLRNLRHINGYRTAGWILLATSSLPFHLFYNSTIFTQIRASDYNVYIVAERFVDGTSVNGSTYQEELDIWDNGEGTLSWLHDNATNLANLTVQECIQNNAQTLQTERGHVLAVTNREDTREDGKLEWVYDTDSYSSISSDPFGWVCSESSDFTPCDYSSALAQKPFKVRDYEIAYCMSQSIPDTCDFQFSGTILLVVVVSNFIKLATMITILLKARAPSLVTLGDCMTSYLLQSDTSISSVRLPDLTLFKKGKSAAFTTARRWDSRRRFWFASASAKRWISCNVLCILGLAISSVILRRGLSAYYFPVDHSLKKLASMGFGEVQLPTIINYLDTKRRSTLIRSVLLANTPQLLLSMLYFGYNAIFTCELVSKEWNDFGHRRKALRVSRPLGEQRSTYWLSLPYRYSLPLMVVAILLHWLFSRALFLVDIKFMEPIQMQDPQYTTGFDGNKTTKISECGYSPIAVIASIIVASFVVLVGLLFGMRRYRAGIPLAGSCSVAIAATCHSGPHEALDFTLHPIQWGVTSRGEDGIGHCAFSGREVEPPNQMDLYRGIEPRRN